MEKTGWLPSAAEFVDQDVADALAIHEAIVAGLRRLRRAVAEMPGESSPDRLEWRKPVCA